MRRVCFRLIANIARSRQLCNMSKRSGVPHTDDELDRLSRAELQTELDRARFRLSDVGSSALAKQWHKRIHWLEGALAQRY